MAIQGQVKFSKFYQSDEILIGEAFAHTFFYKQIRDNVALKGLANSLRSPVKRKREHAEKFMEYQNKRGGKVKLQSILMPSSEFDHAEKGDALYEMELALSLEKLTNEKLLHVHVLANKNNDVQLANFFESEFLGEQVEAIKKISEYVAQLRRVGKGHVGDSCIAKNLIQDLAVGMILLREREKCVLALASPKGNVKILSHNTGHGGMIPELNTCNTNTLICNDTTLCQDICEQNIASPTVIDDDLQEQEKAIRGRDEQLVCSCDPETPTPTKELVSSDQKHVPEFTAKLVATPKYATSTEQTISVTVNKGDDVGNHIKQNPCRKDKRVIQSQKNCQCLNHILWRKKFKVAMAQCIRHGGMKMIGSLKWCYLGVLLSKVTERFRACPDLWDPWILKKPISSFKKDVIDRVRVKGTPKDKSNSSNDVWEDWSATSINWEISDNDVENCERMTMQAASEATECESKGEHDGKIFDMTVDTSLASPAAPNTIIPVKKWDGFLDDFASCFSHIKYVHDERTGSSICGLVQFLKLIQFSDFALLNTTE
ncbi:ferritin-2, chloroplastic [Tanacetum coccineum]